MKLSEAVKIVTENIDEPTRKLFLKYVAGLAGGLKDPGEFLDPLDRDFLALQNDIDKIELRNQVVKAFATIAEDALTKAFLAAL